MNYFYTDHSGAVIGPVTREQLQSLVDSGQPPAGCQACIEGSENWMPLTTFVRPSNEAAPTPRVHAAEVLPKHSRDTGTMHASRRTSSVVVLLLILVGLSATDLYFRIDERVQRAAIVRAVSATSDEIDSKRKAVFLRYEEGMASSETKSIYHQIFHTDTAQLELLNLSVQEQQLVIQLLAGKK